MPAKKFIRLVTGKFREISAVVVSAGAGNDGDIPALDATGKLDASLLPAGLGQNTIAVVTSEALAANDLVNVYDNTGRIVALDLPSMSLRPLALWNVTQGAVVLGDKLASIKYKYNGKTYRWLYKWNHSLPTVQRMFLV